MFGDLAHSIFQKLIEHMAMFGINALGLRLEDVCDQFREYADGKTDTEGGPGE